MARARANRGGRCWMPERVILLNICGRCEAESADLAGWSLWDLRTLEEARRTIVPREQWPLCPQCSRLHNAWLNDPEAP
jgi:hypothetical protein